MPKLRSGHATGEDNDEIWRITRYMHFWMPIMRRVAYWSLWRWRGLVSPPAAHWRGTSDFRLFLTHGRRGQAAALDSQSVARKASRSNSRHTALVDCGSSPCFRIYPPTIYGYAAPVPGVVAPVYRESTLWWPGYYDYAPGQWGRGFPRYGGYGRRAGYHGDWRRWRGVQVFCPRPMAVSESSGRLKEAASF